MAMDEKGLGKRLQTARQAAGLTQQALCQRANLSYSTLAKIERGAIKSPSIFTIQSIAAALDVSLEELLGSPGAGPDQSRPVRHTKSGASFIYFDVNGCLVRSYHQAFSHLAERSGYPIDVVESLYWHYDEVLNRGTMSMSDFNSILRERLGLPDIDWMQYYLSAVEPIPEMRELLIWASGYYRVGLLTNMLPGFLRSLQERHILPDITYASIIDSSEVGAIKPEEAIFTTAQEHAGCNPDEIILIDDTRANLMAVERLGWHGLLFDGYDVEASVAALRGALEPAAL